MITELQDKAGGSPPQDVPEAVSEAVDGVLRRLAPGERNGIVVELTGGDVALAGPVQSWLEKMAVLGAVGRIAGVRSVQDRLWIDPCL